MYIWLGLIAFLLSFPLVFIANCVFYKIKKSQFLTFKAKLISFLSFICLSVSLSVLNFIFLPFKQGVLFCALCFCDLILNLVINGFLSLACQKTTPSVVPDAPFNDYFDVNYVTFLTQKLKSFNLNAQDKQFLQRIEKVIVNFNFIPLSVLADDLLNLYFTCTKYGVT